MRLFLSFLATFFLLLLTIQLTETTSNYYNAETCGYTGVAKMKRAIRAARSAVATNTTETTAKNDEEEEEEEEEEGDDVPVADLLDQGEEVEEGLGTAQNWELTDKVMGGANAALGDIPWAAVLRITRPGGWSLCGGTLISSRHVLTAAHCFWKNQEKNQRECRMDQMMSHEEIKTGVEITVGGICNPEWAKKCAEKWLGEQRKVTGVGFLTEFFLDKCSRSMWDVVLLELDSPVKTTHACLPHLHNLDKFETWKTSMLSFGYGNDPARGKERHQILQKVDLGPAQDPTSCQKTWRLKYNTIVCTTESYTKNVCNGDSGGGIVAQWKGRHYLVGTISFGSSCNAGLENARIANAQVNMDTNLYTATIDQFIGIATPNYRELWKN